MLERIFKTKANQYFILIGLLFFILMFLVEKNNGRFWLNDFKVMYLAAEALLNNEAVYDTAFGLSTGFYKYSPFTLLFFVPFTTLEYETAAYLDFAIISVCTMVLIIQLEQLISRYILINKKPHFIALVLILLTGVVHLVRELHLGNTNIILLLTLTYSLKSALDEKPLKSGALMAIVILTKPYFAICLLPFWLFKQRKAFWYTLASIIVFAGSSILLLGISDGIALYKSWFSAMMAHSTYLESTNTLFSLLNHYLGIVIPVQYATYTLGLLAILAFGYFWWRTQKDKDTNQTTALVVFFYFLIALVPNILVTDTEHFLFSLPFIAIIIFYLRRLKNIKWTIAFIVLFFFYGGHSTDLLGRSLSDIFTDYGFLGLSNLLIIFSVLWAFHKYGNDWETISPKQSA